MRGRAEPVEGGATPAAATRRVTVLAWAAGGPSVPSSRERLYALLPLLEERGVSVLAPPVHRPSPAAAARALLQARRVDAVLIQKRLLPVPYLAALARLAPVVYDYDDAVYALPSGAAGPQAAGRLARNRARLDAVLRRAAVVVAGNSVLAEHARARGAPVVTVPTAVDPARVPRPKEHRAVRPVTIGWVGTPANLVYLRSLEGVFRRLGGRFGNGVRLRVVTDPPSGGVPRFPGIEMDVRRWTLAAEPADLLSFDIGIMPLHDDAWSRGKCGFKLLLYMLAGLPVVASPVGANCEIVRHGEHGFLAESEDAWVEALSALVESPELRARLGRAGRAHVQRHYGPEAAADRLTAAVRSAARRDRGGEERGS